jgi:clan AA aspartic protease
MKGCAMGIMGSALKLTNVFTKQSVMVNALVDTGATFMCVPQSVAVQLGFDTEEVSHTTVTLADGSSKSVPRISPIEITFGDRTCVLEAFVLGDEPLMGVIPMEAMDLVVEPRTQKVVVNPAHPNVPVFLAKGLKTPS